MPLITVTSGVVSNLQVGGGTMPARSAGRKLFDVPPHFSFVPPHEGAQRLFVTD